MRDRDRARESARATGHSHLLVLAVLFTHVKQIAPSPYLNNPLPAYHHSVAALAIVRAEHVCVPAIDKRRGHAAVRAHSRNGQNVCEHRTEAYLGSFTTRTHTLSFLVSVSHIYAYFVFYFIFVDLEPKILKFNFFLKYNNFLFVLQNVYNLCNLPGFLNFL